MKQKILYTIFFLIFIYWPLNLFLANTPRDFSTYLVPALLFGMHIIVYRKYQIFSLSLLTIIPIFEPKLCLLPPILTGIYLIKTLIAKNEKHTRILAVFFAISLLMTMLLWNKFYGQTIFVKDYEAQQEVIRNTQLYNNIFMARALHNKAKIILDKFNYNFLALVDPNNYFFGFHPRQIVIDNQNISKFPFLAFPFLLVGFYYALKDKLITNTIVSLAAAIISLSLLTNFDRQDFIIWLPLVGIISLGVNKFDRRWGWKAFYCVFIILSTLQLIRVILISI